MKTPQDWRTVEVTFYKFEDGKKWVCAWMTSVIGAVELHPTRITPEQWDEIHRVTYDKVQNILSTFY